MDVQANDKLKFYQMEDRNRLFNEEKELSRKHQLKMIDRWQGTTKCDLPSLNKVQYIK